ncbi:hypothetical protein LTR50_004185 [Elasticomyces elasticus]|nr:hypothetical protein LTR50_004185 [Elasticomyces elasticus]
MPHAVDQSAEQDDRSYNDILEGLTGEPQVTGFDLDELEGRPLELGEKADNAVDYEDIGDDDLADEEDEVASVRATSLDYVNHDATTNRPGIPTSHDEDGDDTQEVGEEEQEDQNMIDLFGDENNDEPLLGEEVQPISQTQQPSHMGKLALPKKSGLSLPNLTPRAPSWPSPQLQQRSPESPPSLAFPDASNVTPASMPSADDSPEVLVQMALFARSRRDQEERARRGDQYEPPPPPKTSAELFHITWPNFVPGEAPRFNELFPAPNALYLGKQIPKPPKPLPVTKISLELQQDQERSFRSAAILPSSERLREAALDQRGIVVVNHPNSGSQNSDDEVDYEEFDEDEVIGGVSIQDLNVICEDWDVQSADTPLVSTVGGEQPDEDDVSDTGDWYPESQAPPAKRRKVMHFDFQSVYTFDQAFPSLDDPERATAQLAKRVQLDLNDPALLIDVQTPEAAPTKARPVIGDYKRCATNELGRDISKRYNISNDEAYDLLKENHQHKVRSTIGSTAVEHSLPAVKLQYPFYKVKLPTRDTRAFHRPSLPIDANRVVKFNKPGHTKYKHNRGKDVQTLFAKSQDLTMGDNSKMLLLEYSEEHPAILSNFGMGNRLVNHYRKRNAEDATREKHELGDVDILSAQDKSPFSVFGEVEPGETTSAIHNTMFRAPVFQHEPKPHDFLVVTNSTGAGSRHYYMRNVENVFTVGQQLPFLEVPGTHSRKVTDAAKRRLKTFSYRIHKRHHDPAIQGPALTNEIVRQHLPGSDVSQNRSKMREFMHYNKDRQIWEPKTNEPPPDSETLRSWIKPEDICLLDSMQAGQQHLADLGIEERPKASGEDEDLAEGANIELQLAPWYTTKNFLNACQGKAMLKLHGEGDPTGRGEGFSFVKTSMKGGFRAVGESVQDKMDALKQNGGHSYNVARQQRNYEDSIKRVWEKQKQSLSSNTEYSDYEGDEDEVEEPEVAAARRVTPRSSFGTPVAFGRRDDETGSQFSRSSMPGSKNTTLVITRKENNEYGEMETRHIIIKDPRVISLYKRRKAEQKLKDIGTSLLNLEPTGDIEADEAKKKHLETELTRLMKNQDRRYARERAKGRAISPDTAGPEGTGTASGRNKNAGTQRKCANCGMVGHIKTNKKSDSTSLQSWDCPSCQHKQHITGEETSTSCSIDQNNTLYSHGVSSLNSPFSKSGKRRRRTTKGNEKQVAPVTALGTSAYNFNFF